MILHMLIMYVDVPWIIKKKTFHLFLPIFSTKNEKKENMLSQWGTF